eukprot:5209715-Prymnesium_polylepis.3
MDLPVLYHTPEPLAYKNHAPACSSPNGSASCTTSTQPAHGSGAGGGHFWRGGMVVGAKSTASWAASTRCSACRVRADSWAVRICPTMREAARHA